mgnify:CR=1 FL=1
MLAGAVFLFTVATRRDGPEVTNGPGLPDQPLVEVEVRQPSTHEPGARVQLDREAAQDEPAEVSLCMQRWWMLEPSLQGDLVVELDADEAGRVQAWVLDHRELPAPVHACLARAVFEVDRELPPERPWKERWGFPADE